MKSIILVATTAFALATAPALAQKMDDMKGMDMGKKSAAGNAVVHGAKATVKAADQKAGTVVLAHGPVSTLNWPPMTMKFLVKDKTLWGKLGEGKQVEVEFAQEGKDYVVTRVK